ncbi:MAG: heat-inducible transcription repressor HrcA [Nitrospinae bacterium]|nr:heat-inducible transcription repressor HrcA [Nitrospinota bacterium]
MNPVLDERSQSILLELVRDYIEEAEPVGSRTLARKHFHTLSPATIRNVMSDLEEMGYLHQPHVSAGRIPTDQGYRFFVNHLIDLPTLPDLDVSSDPDDPISKIQSFAEVLETACNQLSEDSHQTGLVMLPSFSNTRFKHIEFVKVGLREALAVFYSELGILQNKIIPIESDVTQDLLTSISKFLNDEFSGKTIKTIRRELLHRIRNEREHYNQLAKRAMELSAQVFSEEDDSGNLLVEGALNFLDQPEFSADLEKIKALFKTLEEKTKLIKLLDLCLQQDGLTVLIGEENIEEEMSGCSLIARNYGLGEDKVGTIAVFGPKRMDYKKIISVVNCTAQKVSELLAERKKEFYKNL